MNLKTNLLSALVLAIMLAGGIAQAGESLWRVEERIDIEAVPSWFPVGFSLLTAGERQYVAYYNAQHQLTVATRALDQRQWQTVKLDSKVGWDSHNYLTMACDAAGNLHLAGNMHCVPLVYFCTESPGDITTLRRKAMTGQDEARCTYPVFMRDAAGRLIFHYRDGSSGNGRRLYNVYDDKTQTWSRLLQTPLFDGQGQRNAYPLGPIAGPDKRFHVHWVWRDTPDCATNNNLSYARSPDLIHWETATGEPIALPMTLATKSLIVDPVPSGGGMINGGSHLVFDSLQRPLIVYHKSDPRGNMQIYAARFDDGKWTIQSLTAWEQPVRFSGGGAMPFIGIQIATPQRTPEGAWIVGYHHRDYGRGSVAFDETTLQPVTANVTPPQRELPAELNQSEIQFEGVGARQAGDLGKSNDPHVRYVLTWATLPANHDRPRNGPLPPPAMLRLCKLVRAEPVDKP
jgi:hypothetical protein